ncbi:MAG: hypothetical protein M1113_05130 [Candidatus Thermoplasmatota archaeon]|nr:hypothetical protein [Candidatus Thermoplasmatota archaeon]
MRNSRTESLRDIISARMRSWTCSERGIPNLTHNSGHYATFIKLTSKYYTNYMDV